MRIPLLLFVAASFLLSCSEQNANPATSEAVSLMNLKTGNYWVYDWYEIDVNGIEKKLDKKDSIVITSSTVVNGRTIFIQNGNFMGSSDRHELQLFDSASSIYSLPGRQVMLSLDQSREFPSPIGPTDSPLFIAYYSIDTETATVHVPSGDFATINFKGRVEPIQSNYPFGIRTLNNYYAKGTGLVKRTCYLTSSPNTLEMRLVKTGSL